MNAEFVAKDELPRATTEETPGADSTLIQERPALPAQAPDTLAVAVGPVTIEHPGRSEQEAADSLLAQHKITISDLQRISEAMQDQNLTFGEAAVQLGFVSAEDIERAFELPGAVESLAQKNSLVETVLRKMTPGKALVRRQGAPVKPGEHIMLVRDPYNPYSEQIRALRTELLLRCPPRSGGANILALMSANGAEGRSQLSAELAIAFAQLGGRTLLVDADFRSPRQHLLFNCDNTEGLSQAIEAQQPPCLHRVEGLPSMSLLTSGPVPPNPVELLSDGRFAKCMLRWRDKYEHIVIDAPPLVRGADGLAIAAIAGHVLVLTRTKRTSQKQVRELLRRLVNTQAQIVGAVVNNF